MKKRLLTAVLAVILTLSLAACRNGDGESANLPTPGNNNESSLSTDFQKNMSQTDAFEIPYLCETEDGYYFQHDAFVYFIDKQTKAATILCAKPDCVHNDNSCNAFINSLSLSYANSKLYFMNGDRVLENGKYNDYGWRLYSIDVDGTNRTNSQSLEFTPGGDTSPYKTTPIIHRGNVFFTYKGVVYSVPLGEEIDNATAIWGEESGGGNSAVMVVDPNALQYTLWADGDYMYFMANIKQSNGTYKDTLYSYDPQNGEVKKVWQVPEKSEVGTWSTTGVSVSSWYISGGYLYYYLMGNDLWYADLSTGKNIKLADVNLSAGEAIFSSEYIVVMNKEIWGQDLISGSAAVKGGDTLYVYNYSGELVKEISLKQIYDDSVNVSDNYLLWIDDDDVFILANATINPDDPSITHTTLVYRMYKANIKSGKVTKAGWSDGE